MTPNSIDDLDLGKIFADLFNENNPFGGKMSRIRYPNGWVYEGEMKGNKRHGQGKLTFTDGNVYEGGFRNNFFSGMGTIYGPAGNIFRGKFWNGRREGKGYEYVIEGGKCTSYCCNYINGIREGRCTVMTCENFRFGKFNDWQGDRVEFYKKGQLLETADWEYSRLRDYRSYILERELYDNLCRDKYEARDWMEMTTLDQKVRQTPGIYARDHLGPYHVLKEAFEGGLYYEIVDALVYGFSFTEQGEIPLHKWESRQEAIALYKALAKKGLLENKRNFTNFDDYMYYTLNCFYECIKEHPCDFYVYYCDAIPYVVACLYNGSQDWRYIWGIRRFYLRYVNGAISYCMYLMDLKDNLEDFDNNYYTAMEMAFKTYAFKQEGLYELAQAHYNARNYDVAGCWLVEKE